MPVVKQSLDDVQHARRQDVSAFFGCHNETYRVAGPSRCQADDYFRFPTLLSEDGDANERCRGGRRWSSNDGVSRLLLLRGALSWICQAALQPLPVLTITTSRSSLPQIAELAWISVETDVRRRALTGQLQAHQAHGKSRCRAVGCNLRTDMKRLQRCLARGRRRVIEHDTRVNDHAPCAIHETGPDCGT
jgi:hypothetical protein